MSEAVAKDFKVKHGLTVVNGGSFGGPIIVGNPTLINHAATKAYVDAIALIGGGGGGGSITVSELPPEIALTGAGWFQSSTNSLAIFDGTDWLQIQAGLKVESSDGTAIPSKMFVGQEEPSTLSVTNGDLWNDIDDDAGATEFIFSGPEQPENFDVDTLWIDTDEPELPLIYADNEPPEYTNIEGDFWVDLDDTFGTQFVQSDIEPSPQDAEFWVDLNSEEGGVNYQDLFKDGASQILTPENLPIAEDYPGMISYVASNKSLYVSSNGSWNKIYPNNDAEALVWMGI